MSALALPRLTQADATATRRDNAPRAVLTVAGGARLSPCTSDPDAEELGPLLSVTLRVGRARAHVLLPRAMMTAQLRALDPTLEDEALPDDLAALLLETALRDDLDRLEGVCGEPIAIEGVAVASPTRTAAHRFLAEHGGHRWAMAVTAADGVPIDALIGRWPLAPRAMTRLPLPAMIRLGTTWLPRGALASLRPDDVVLVQFTEAAGARLVVAEGLIAGVARRDEGWALTEPPRPVHHADKREWTMQHDSEAAPVERPLSDVDDLPLQLAFDLGTVAMTLGELRTLGAGAVITLARAQQDLVRISAHGALVGHGELVEVEGRVGVRIVRLFDHG